MLNASRITPGMASGATLPKLKAPALPYEHPSPGSSRSISVTSAPRRSRCQAVQTPTMPAPTTTMALRPFPLIMRSQHPAARVLDQVHVLQAGGEPHLHALACAGVGAHAPAHVDAVDAEEHQRLHAERLGDLEHGVDMGRLRLAVGLGLGQVLRAQAEGEAVASDMPAIARGAPRR